VLLAAKAVHLKQNTMQKNGEHFSFITDKIKEIKIALFKSEINSELWLPNNIVQILRVDDNGHVWFFTSCSKMHAAHINRSFYAYLDFHKRGTDSRLLINGPASIVDEEDDKQALLPQSNYSSSLASSLVLVKMKIMQAEYYDGHEQPNGSWTDRFMHTINSLFFTSNHKIIDFG
jgi:general stress protein 26